jgi:hypothetical protein
LKERSLGVKKQEEASSFLKDNSFLIFNCYNIKWQSLMY